MKKFSLLLGMIVFLVTHGFSQLITATPALPTDQNSVEIVFDATQGNAALAGYTGDVYVHTGVITNLSTGPSDWKYVITPWPNSGNLALANTAKNKLVSLGNNKWKLDIGPSIRSFYNVAAGEVIQKLAFVFRNADGSLQGKTSTGSDIFYDVSPASLSVSITSPTDNFLFLNLNATLNVSASSLYADSTLLYVNGIKVAGTNASTLNATVTGSNYGRYLVKAVAKTATAMVADSFYYYVRPNVTVAELPAGMKDGINYLSETSVLLSLYAPLKQYAFAIGDFNNWLPDENTYMKRTPDGKRYWVQLNGLVPGKEYIYQYMVDGNIRIGDPYADKVSDPWNDIYISSATYPNMLTYPTGKTTGIATVLQTAKPAYVWNSTSFVPPANTNLVIYELLVRDFTDKHSFQSVIDTLGYLKKLGINAIELMPVNEFEGNLSWGYNPNYYCAVDKYYGPANDFKKLVDICHQNGIAVIMDAVFNHSFGTSPYVMLYWDAANNRPSAESPFYNPIAKHDYNVGYDMNHESADTKNYISHILKYWLNEYHIDGYRFDLSKGFTQNNTLGNVAAWGQYDASRIAILSAYHDTIVAANPNAVLILEHFADNSEETVLASRNMMLWGNLNYNYGQAAMGYTGSDLSWGSYLARGWTKPNLVTYMESHDEERETFRCINYGAVNGSYSIKDTATALQRDALTAAFFFTIPGPKMIWQFGERGYDYSINYPSMTSNSRTDSKPPRWDYMNKPERQALYKTYARLIALKKTDPLFSTSDYQLNVGGSVKRIGLHLNNEYAVVLGNFGTTADNVSPAFPQAGKWYDFISGDSLLVTDVNANLIFKAGEYRLYTNQKITSLGINTQQEEPFSVIISPNPVKNVTQILVTGTGSENIEIRDFNLFGVEMEKIYTGRISSQLQLSWAPKTSGIHLLIFRIGNQQLIRKVVVE